MWYGREAPAVAGAAVLAVRRGCMALRSLLYRLGLRHRIKVGAPVVVVGNLTVGGTGKTPLVAWLRTQRSRTRDARGHRVARLRRPGAAVSRASPCTAARREVGDEPLLLARRAQCHGVHRARPGRGGQSARWAMAPTSCSAMMDCNISRWCGTCEIVVIDGQRGFGNGRLLPRGPAAREPARGCGA